MALISPYVRDVNETVIAYFKESGIDTVDFFSFEEDKELGVASISPESIRSAAVREPIQWVEISFENHLKNSLRFQFDSVTCQKLPIYGVFPVHKISKGFSKDFSNIFLNF